MNNEQTKTNITQVIETSSKWVALVVLLANLWLAAKLAPLGTNIAILATRVQALEDKVPTSVTDHSDIQVIKQQVTEINNNVKEIKGYLNLRVEVSK